jgi:Mn-containing catalase
VNVPAIREPQNQWRIVLEEGFEDHMPIPGSFPQEENQEFSYAFMSTLRGDREAPENPGRRANRPTGTASSPSSPSNPAVAKRASRRASRRCTTK